MLGEPPRHLGAVPERPGSPPDLEHLLHATALGDEEAFAQLYDRLAPGVYGLARRVIRDAARAEEVTQEVFLWVWRHATRFDPAKGSAQAWILTVTHRRAVDLVRADDATTRRETSSGGHDVPFDVVSEEVSTRLQATQVRLCLGGLTDLQREAVTLAYYRGYTYPEVAALLKVNLATVKSRMRDGLIRLRDCLGGAT